VSTPSETAANSSSEVVDRRYYKAGATWEDDTHRSIRRSRTLAWIVSGVSGLVAVLSLLALVLILPLRQFEPYVVEVDKSTGYLEIKLRRPLRDGPSLQRRWKPKSYAATEVQVDSGLDGFQSGREK
jgi:type IV secretory pathway component VirB8